MGPRLRELISIASAGLGVDGWTSPLLGAGGLRDRLVDFLGTVNGFYAFEGALHVLPAGAALRPGQRTLEEWNDPEPWRGAYGSLADGHLFFAEDAFGGQFSIRDEAVCTFDPETGDAEILATDLEGWADKILSDYAVLTGSPLGHDWQVRHGPLPIGQRLAPKLPFVLGGEFVVDNLFAVDAVEGMRMRGDLASQLRDRPDGATVRYHVIDGDA